jgi:hypothetical protein
MIQMPIWMPIRQRRAGGHSAQLYLSGSLTLFALDGAPAYHDVTA